MIHKKLLNAVGIERTYNTLADELEYTRLSRLEENWPKIDAAYKEIDFSFYRFFANYGTGIGETIEEVMGGKFNDIIPKIEPKVNKSGRLLKGFIKSKIYTDYNRTTGKKPTNYDWLGVINAEIKSIEVKVIRAAESKENQENKLYEIPSLLEERALTYAERDRSGNGTFQQTKPEMFDYLLGIVIYADCVDFYLVPSIDIRSGKLKITNQHAGAIMEDGSTNEGHLAVKDLESYKILSVFNEEELLAKDTLSKYIK